MIACVDPHSHETTIIHWEIPTYMVISDRAILVDTLEVNIITQNRSSHGISDIDRYRIYHEISFYTIFHLTINHTIFRFPSSSILWLPYFIRSTFNWGPPRGLPVVLTQKIQQAPGPLIEVVHDLKPENSTQEKCTERAWSFIFYMYVLYIYIFFYSMTGFYDLYWAMFGTIYYRLLMIIVYGYVWTCGIHPNGE